MTNANANANGDTMQEAAVVYTDELEEKILFGLSIYKFVSPTMLHTFLGTSTPVDLWKKQVLAKLLADGRVLLTTITLTSPAQRSQSYSVLHLPENEFTTPSATSSADIDPHLTRARATESDQAEADAA